MYGKQEQSAYNGYFESVCYHPLFLFNRQGDCLAAKLRPGNVRSAEGWEELLLPEIERQHQSRKEVAFRGDAALAEPEIYQALEERGVKYAVRLPANENLERDIEELLTRPVGRPSQRPVVHYKGFLYQAASWSMARRVVVKVEFHAGELFPVWASSSPTWSFPAGRSYGSITREGRQSSGSRRASWRSVGPVFLAIVSEGMKCIYD